MGGSDGSSLESLAYGRLRRIAAGVLTALVSILVLADVASAEYRADPVVLGLLLGALLVLLGVEAGTRLLR